MSNMELKELLEKARNYNGLIKTPEDLLSHLDRVQRCMGCGLDYYDKVCPKCQKMVEDSP